MKPFYVDGVLFSDELYHHGIKGQRWGVRRYQNPDGSLTPEGRQRYRNPESGQKNLNKIMEGNSRYTRDRSYDEASYEAVEAELADKLDGDDYKMFRFPAQLAERESGLREARRARDEVLKERNRNLLNPFKAKQLQQKYELAEEKRKRAFEDYLNIAANLSMEYINQLPKEDRDLAKRYVYLWMGLDW